MAKETKKTNAQKAAEQNASTQKAPAQEKVILNNNNNPATKGLTQGEKVAYVAAIQTERQFMMTNTENPSQEMISGMTMLAQATILDIAIGEIASTGSAMGRIITANEGNYNALQAWALERGIRLPNYKALPAPTEEDLKNAGIIGFLPSDTRVLKVSADNVSKETINDKKKEMETVKKAVDNPAEIQNDEQLKASLTAMLVKPITQGPDGISARVSRTIKFYNGYLTIQANKIEDAEKKKAAIEAVKARTMTDTLEEISNIVGSCPFVIHGGAYMLRKMAAQTGNPIAPFCLYRRTATQKDSADDQSIADIVRTLIVWSCKGVIADNERNIKEAERLIKKKEEDSKSKDAVVAKDAKAAIKKCNEEISNKFNPIIASMNEIIEEISNPSFDIVDNLIANYNGDAESEEYALSRRMVGDIMKTYYKDLNREKLDEATMLATVQQRAGVIFNMFRSPLNQNQNYSEAYISELKEIEKPAEESK